MGMSVVDEAVAEERFRRMYAAYERQVYAYCLRRIDRDQAIDCTADTFLVAWRRKAGDERSLDDAAKVGTEVAFRIVLYNTRPEDPCREFALVDGIVEFGERIVVQSLDDGLKIGAQAIVLRRRRLWQSDD